MPLLEIEIVGEVKETAVNGLARRLADAAGGVFGSAPHTTWVRLRVLSAANYSENEGAAAGIAPVFVKVTQRTNPERDALRTEIRSLTEAIARVCGRPAENVHVCYEPPADGRQAFGGRLVEVEEP